jgi:hypothetical protein
VEKYGTTGQATDDNVMRRMRCACWITKARDAHSEYVILIAFPLQKWLRERACANVVRTSSVLLKDSKVLSYLTTNKNPSKTKYISCRKPAVFDSL